MKDPAMLALENLTPGGSEFVDDIARCVAFIKQRQASQHQVILGLGRQLRALKGFLAEEREKVRETCAGVARLYQMAVASMGRKGVDVAEDIEHEIRQLDLISGRKKT